MTSATGWLRRLRSKRLESSDSNPSSRGIADGSSSIDHQEPRNHPSGATDSTDHEGSNEIGHAEPVPTSKAVTVIPGNTDIKNAESSLAGLSTNQLANTMFSAGPANVTGKRSATNSLGKLPPNQKEARPDEPLEHERTSISDLVNYQDVAGGITRDDLKMFVEQINLVDDVLPKLMALLDNLVAVHPFAKVAVWPFKAVYELEMKRRETDKIILALRVDMKDTMFMLGRLIDIRPNSGPLVTDGSGENLVFQEFLRGMMEGIKLCANICSAYRKKDTLARFLFSPIWQAKFTQHSASLVDNRRKLSEFLAVDTNVTVRMVSDDVRHLAKRFEALAAPSTPEELEMAHTVEKEGGVSKLKSDRNLLRKVDKEQRRKLPASTTDRDLSGLLEKPDSSIEKNMARFLSNLAEEQGAILSSLDKKTTELLKIAKKSGPSAKILDVDIQTLWESMEWKANVKARHFVLALREHFSDQLLGLHSSTEAGQDKPSNSSLKISDAWAIRYLDTLWLQPIIEAFDDDASGFITINEMNRFTNARPKDWSLPVWIAYWAVGWKATMIQYANKIEALLQDMDRLGSESLPVNREAIRTYEFEAWMKVYALVAAIKDETVVTGHGQFTDFVSAEETRLEKKLEDYNYFLDDESTLGLIIGRERGIEKSVFALIYLLLQRHHQILTAASSVVLSAKELNDCSTSLNTVLSAMSTRAQDLHHTFTQQRLDLESQFDTFAHGIFKFIRKPEKLYTRDYLETLVGQSERHLSANHSSNVGESAGVEVNNLRYKLGDDPTLHESIYDGYTVQGDSQDPTAEELKMLPFLGYWHGFWQSADSDDSAEDGWISLHSLHLQSDGGNLLKGAHWSIRGKGPINGTYSKAEDKFEITLSLGGFSPLMATEETVTFECNFTDSNLVDRLLGHSPEYRMILRRMGARYIPIYPINRLKNTTRLTSSAERWAFLRSAILSDVRRRTLSFISTRRKHRMQMKPLWTRFFYHGRLLDREDMEKLLEYIRSADPEDALFNRPFFSQAALTEQVHGGWACDACGGDLGRLRLVCIECRQKEGWIEYTSDFHDDPLCFEAPVDYLWKLIRPHEPTHRLVKLRVFVPFRKLGRVYKDAAMSLITVDSVTRILAARSSDNNVEGIGEGPTCKHCQSALSFPFWYCIQCNDGTFTCDECEAKRTLEYVECDFYHNRMRCAKQPEKKKEDMSADERIAELEAQVSTVRNQLAEVLQLLRASQAALPIQQPASTTLALTATVEEVSHMPDATSPDGETTTHGEDRDGSSETGMKASDDAVKTGEDDEATDGNLAGGEKPEETVERVDEAAMT